MLTAAIIVAVVFGLALFGLKYVPLDGTRQSQQREDYIDAMIVVNGHIQEEKTAA